MKQVFAAIAVLSSLAMAPTVNMTNMHCLAATPGADNPPELYGKPDFAFPKQIIATSAARLTAAERSHDARAMMRALIDLTLAENVVSADNLGAIVERVQGLRAAESNPETAAMLDLLLARIYADAYSSNRYTYDQRPPVLGEAPADVNEWSGDRFIARIMQLTDGALADARALQAIPLTAYKDVAECGEDYLETYRPSLLDFIATQVYDILGSVESGHPDVKLRRGALVSAMTARCSGNPPLELSWRLREVELKGAASKEAFGELSELFDIYFKKTPASLEALAAMYGHLNSGDRESTRLVWADARSYVARYPDYARTNEARNILSALETVSLKASCPNVIYPRQPLEVLVTTTNATEFTVTMWAVPDKFPITDNYISGDKEIASLRRVTSVKGSAAGEEIPFSKEVRVQLPVETPGRYAVSVSAGATETPSSSLTVVTCSRLAAFRVSDSENIGYAVDALTGDPINGAHFTRYAYKGRSLTASPMGTATGADGATALPLTLDGTLVATKGGDMSPALRVWPYSRADVGEPVYALNGWSSLPLYHPGDTLEWAAVAYKAVGCHRELLAGRTVTAQLRDANDETVMTESLKTDEWGRVSSRAALPADRLGGSWSMELALEDASSATSSTGRRPAASERIYFEVSDYKLPSYEISLDTPQPMADGAFRISGRLSTYTGMMMPDCAVSLDLQSRRPFRLWYSAPAQSFFASHAVSGADGRFTFEVPADVLSAAPYPGGVLTAQVSAVSPTGETRRSTVSFSRRKLCIIMASVPNLIDINEFNRLLVKAADLDDKPLHTDFAWRLLTADDTVALEGVVTGEDGGVDWSRVTPGSYSLELRALSFPESEPLTLSGLTLYSAVPGSPSPSASPVWVRPATAEIAPDGTLRVLYANPAGEGSTLFTVSDPITGKTLERRWESTRGGVAIFETVLPAGVSRAEVTAVAVRACGASTVTVHAESVSPRDAVRILTTTMRDKTMPLATERWTFRIEYADSTAARSAVIAGMYAKAIEELARGSWTFPIVSAPMARTNVTANSRGLARYTYHTRYRPLSVAPLEPPTWQLWGLDYSRDASMLYGRRGRGMILYKAASPMMANDPGDLASDDLTVEETEECAADSGASAASPDAPEINYRPSEIPLAFFRPDIVTGDDGSLTLEFTMPNALTTWQMRMVSYTREVVSGSYAATITATKPLMVQPTLPRYVRSGDRVEVATAVYNKTDEPMSVNLRAEAADAASGDLLASVEKAVDVLPGAPVTVTLPVDVTLPAGSLMRWRVSGVAGNHTDGEQACVPVLQSEASVTESTPFYIVADSTAVTLRLPDIPSDASVTLQYCDNPVWLAVMALPALSDAQASTSTEAAGNLLMSVAAANIVRTWPTIAEAIRRWSGGDRDALTSMLERDNDLKQLVLQATPWMREAADDTERLQRLALLLDPANTDAATESSLRKLAELQQPDGGWRWSAGSSESSLWATRQVLAVAGALNSLGWMPTQGDFPAMVQRALKHYDTLTLARWRKSPKSELLGYAMIRINFPACESAASRELLTAAATAAARDWKKYGPVAKAQAARLLAGNGHADIAREILRSLTEYAQTSPDRGIWWEGVDLDGQTEILQAYAALKASSREVDAIRRWIIFEKESTGWNDMPGTALAVARLLVTGNPVEASPAPIITLGGAEISVPADADYGSGFFSRPLDAGAASGAELTVCHAPGTPSWGAVVVRYSKGASSVQSHQIPDLSIEKVLLAEVAGDDGVKWRAVNEAPLGANMKVQLTLKAGRTIDYVTIVDERAACLAPTDQLPAFIMSQGLMFYRENRDSATRIFIDRLPKGTYVLTYDVSASEGGTFTGGVATVQSQMTPSLTAHSSGEPVHVSGH